MREFFQDKKTIQLTLSIAINSLLSFAIAILIIKGLIGLVKYLTISHFSGIPELIHYEVICASPPYSPIWTYRSVISIYSVGVLFALFLVPLFYLMQRKTKYNAILRLMFIWLYILSLHHSFGMIIKGVIVQQDVYYALLWMHIPKSIMYIFAVFISVAYIYMLYNILYTCLKISPSQTLINTPERKTRFFIFHYILVAIVGYGLLFSPFFKNIQLFEFIEITALIVPLAFATLKNTNKKVTVFKENSTSKIQALLAVWLVGILFFYIVIIAYV